MARSRSGVKRPGLEAGLRRGQRAPGLERRVGSQRGRPLEERRGRREAAAALRSSARPLQRGSDGFVGPGRGKRPMPGAAVGVELEIAHLGQGFVHAASIVG